MRTVFADLKLQFGQKREKSCNAQKSIVDFKNAFLKVETTISHLHFCF